MDRHWLVYATKKSPTLSCHGWPVGCQQETPRGREKGRGGGWFLEHLIMIPGWQGVDVLFIPTHLDEPAEGTAVVPVAARQVNVPAPGDPSQRRQNRPDLQGGTASSWVWMICTLSLSHPIFYFLYHLYKTSAWPFGSLQGSLSFLHRLSPRLSRLHGLLSPRTRPRPSAG